MVNNAKNVTVSMLWHLRLTTALTVKNTVSGRMYTRNNILYFVQ
jgi:cell division protein FtsX